LYQEKSGNPDRLHLTFLQRFYVKVHEFSVIQRQQHGTPLGT
jgi:hypothetical protein